jgi:hypothetical protein
MRTICVSVALLSLLLPERGLQASELMELTLSCDGKTTNMMADSDTKPESVTKMGVLVNLREGTVLGFGHPARIKSSDAASVDFGGESGNWSVQGTIDRITGSVEATTMLMNQNTNKIIMSYSWDLHCSPVKRVF